MQRRWSALSTIALAVGMTGCGPPDPPLALDVWYGAEQRVGHLGDGQSDFNLLGETTSRQLTYSLNDGPEVALTVSRDPFGFRRLGGPGHFNADIPVAALTPGTNRVRLRAEHEDGSELVQEVRLERTTGTSPLPYSIDWSTVSNPQDVGWCVDGRWTIEGDSLRSSEPAYDRVYAIGDRTWRDYEVQTTFTIHRVAATTAPFSGGNAFGVVFRFNGHCVGGPLDFPEAQPKWGYLPFGAITWLRWKKGAPHEPPQFQFYRGDRNELENYATLEFQTDQRYHLIASCVTLPDSPAGEGVTRYRLKVWPEGAPEPEAPAYEVTQVSQDAHRQGGLALVAHHVDVSVGAIEVRSIP
ncbi:MAG: hypothetical protein R3F49_16845 [Planctomycetota bacterium]